MLTLNRLSTESELDSGTEESVDEGTDDEEHGQALETPDYLNHDDEISMD
jgi:hypothetical protein